MAVSYRENGRALGSEVTRMNFSNVMTLIRFGIFERATQDSKSGIVNGHCIAKVPDLLTLQDLFSRCYPPEGAHTLSSFTSRPAASLTICSLLLVHSGTHSSTQPVRNSGCCNRATSAGPSPTGHIPTASHMVAYVFAWFIRTLIADLMSFDRDLMDDGTVDDAAVTWFVEGAVRCIELRMYFVLPNGLSLAIAWPPGIQSSEQRFN